MAYLAATDVTVTILARGIVGKTRRNYCSIYFDSTSLTYTITTGIPLPASVEYYGLMKLIHHMIIVPGHDGLVYQYDKTNHSIRVFRSAALATHTHNMTFIGGIATTEAVMIAGGDTLGKNASTNRTILGADVATKGGVVAVSGSAAAALGEFTNNTALGGAITLYADVIGV